MTLPSGVEPTIISPPPRFSPYIAPYQSSLASTSGETMRRPGSSSFFGGLAFLRTRRAFAAPFS